MLTQNLYEGMIVLDKGTMCLITSIEHGIVSFLNLDTHQLGAYEVKNYEVPFEPFTCNGANAIVNYNKLISALWAKYLS